MKKTEKTSAKLFKPFPEDVKLLLGKLPRNMYGISLVYALLLSLEGYDLRAILPKATYYRIKRRLRSFGFTISGGSAHGC